jgi:hypothetical protein
MKKPVVAAVQGHVLGGGCELVMLCDMTIAADNATFGEPEVDALVWAFTELLVEEIASWGIYETTRRKAEAVIKARLAAGRGGASQGRARARLIGIPGAASGMEAGGGIAHARTRHRRRPDIIDRHGARHDPTPTGRDREAELFRGLEVDDEIELHRLLDGKVAGVGSLQDAIDIGRRPAEVVRRIRPVGRQAAVVGVRT